MTELDKFGGCSWATKKPAEPGFFVVYQLHVDQPDYFLTKSAFANEYSKFI
jgi:hypothetical protein